MSLIATFAGAFHSAATYREVRASGKFYMGYAFFVVAICTLLVTVAYAHLTYREIFVAQENKPALFEDVFKQIARQLPVMTLQQKQLMMHGTTPTVITVSGEAFGEVFQNIELITIDTTGQTSHETMTTPILVTSKDLIFKSDRETKIKSIAELLEDESPTLVINRAVAESLADAAIKAVRESLTTLYLIIGIIAWFFIAAYMFVMRLFMLLILGLAGLLIGSLIKSPIKYASAVGLAAVSYTPIAILDTILFAVLHYPTSHYIMFFAGCVALFAAMRCSSTPPPPQMIG